MSGSRRKIRRQRIRNLRKKLANHHIKRGAQKKKLQRKKQLIVKPQRKNRKRHSKEVGKVGFKMILSD